MIAIQRHNEESMGHNPLSQRAERSLGQIITFGTFIVLNVISTRRIFNKTLDKIRWRMQEFCHAVFGQPLVM